MSALSGRVAIVTGASRGLGAAIARHLAEAGAAVAVVDLKEGWAASTAQAITDAGGRAIAVGADVSSRDAVHDAVERTARELGPPDVLVNNAMWNRYDPLDAITEDTADRMLGTGLGAVAWGIQAVTPHMAARGGAIINIASVAARVGMANALLYCGVKAGVEGMTRAASVELGPVGIRVNAVAPSTIATEGLTAMLGAARVAARAEQTPLGRLGTPLDIAEAVLFLASDAASFITGQTLYVDGGIAHAIG
ncbi:SDR family NAD(P)-dependent oxidoreductase [Sphingomonas sp.]|uniref:SDR family NAD(P)-dependent oxidoreductase n=1 Tax=Sphingomonas sp. TaxID=28214 RepID=UPI002DD662C9|nr:SDR family NAD(P)-dependent oxidoreductase [Sphingomonas sp.]